MTSAILTLVGKPGCHLCDQARVVIEQVLAELVGHPNAPALALTEVSILEDAELHARFVEEIPVLLINGRVHNYWHIDPERLRAALLAL
ncbi:glutaredoxin family protein [Homoserinimonas sp. OAct 916]|uniref:glutaredoxin family protein n=1 Tax=Homoserinimonas sp. OAct 916 TaxID=2211450 RepID=UPI000DBE213C|nr:glutaredoxin family protein [Homoserinimonas sp. OAct 916]